jgi:acetyltransferase-like isoleucine patch superfamily enzyme
MTTYSIYSARQWLKTSPNPVAQNGLRLVRSLRLFELPAPRLIYRPLYTLHRLVTGLLSSLTRIVYWTPLFKSRCVDGGKQLYLYGGMPYLSGPLHIRYGDRCRISGQTTFSGRAASRQTPQLVLGNNIDIGWMSTITVAGKVSIGNNVRIAGRAFIAGYPGHPLNADERAAGLPDHDSQTGDITIEDDVWIATGVTILPNVRIGKRSIIAAGSIVSRDIPADVIAAGSPAKVIKSLQISED